MPRPPTLLRPVRRSSAMISVGRLSETSSESPTFPAVSLHSSSKTLLTSCRSFPRSNCQRRAQLQLTVSSSSLVAFAEVIYSLQFLFLLLPSCSLSFNDLKLLEMIYSNRLIQHPKKQYHPCKNLVLYFHDIIYNGKNKENATSAIVAASEGANMTILAGQFHFGNIAVFDDPITLDNNLHSSPVGRAQGMYLYDTKNAYTSWLGFSFVLNSTDYYKGSINFAGADPIMVKTRDIYVNGGTGDFFMHRGIATLMTDAYEGEVYFKLRVDIKFYECW
ncbi:disease resistance response protein 206-like [Rutidosis leptorrhynchoides]|uniref:disease resistance response protein 206-like n=1 Tax=Rutidosis leptorrhynchoides TaxID=125765 RepID=UPI003A9A2079